MYTKLSASRAYVYAVARACDAGNVSRQVGRAFRAFFALLRVQDCAGAILYSSDRAVEVAMEAQQCLVSPCAAVQCNSADIRPRREAMDTSMVSRAETISLV